MRGRRARAQRERERERKNPENPEEPDSDHRPRPRRTPKPIVLDPYRRPRSRRTPKPIVLDPDRCPRSRSRLRADHDRSTNRLHAISPVVEPSRDRIMNFFFLGVICVSGLRNEIIYLFGSRENLRKCEQEVENVFSMVFSTTQPNTRKYFSQYFPKYNQILENIFLSGK